VRTAAALAIMLLALASPGCGGRAVPQDERAAQANAAREPAEAQVGALRLRASIAPTASLGEAIATRYGVARDPRSVLLLVGARRVDGGDEVPLPASLDVGVRDLRGVRRAVPMREVRSDGFIDYVGEIRVAPPDTLSFDVSADAGEAGVARLEFTREIYRP
jgi:hypothetical protein